MKNLNERITQANTLIAPYAVPHGNGIGREHGEERDTTRFPFQRDRDRIIHTQAFRRLKGKTQVFVAGEGDHYRTRLTHTMEVAQISRDMARTLQLNEDLVECIALAHDLGHTPFGHAGEEQMCTEMRTRRSLESEDGEFKGNTFEHNKQSLRIITLLEERTKKYQGLNLNREVLEGLMKHRTIFDQEQKEPIPRNPSLEAQVVNLADEIAYTAHDVDDGLRSEILTLEELRTIPLFREAEILSKLKKAEVRGNIIHLLVMDAYTETERRLTDQNIKALKDVYKSNYDLVCFSEEMTKKLTTLRTYLRENFYFSREVRSLSEKGMTIVHRLFEAYENNPPKKVLTLQKKTGGNLTEAIKDYIAGMTDVYAGQQLAVNNKM